MPDRNEVFDVVDETDRVVGEASRSLVHKHNLMHRAVHVFFQSRPGYWMLQRRSAQKDMEPLLWTSSCSGHVDKGEEYVESAIRECQEELGLELVRSEVEEVFRCSQCSETENEFVRVYRARASGKVIPSPEEIIEMTELRLDEIEVELAREPRCYASSFRHLFPFLKKKLSLT
jgi:isopentenyl-diphosphate delta-isomerase